jgi:hypothetical protein
MINFFAELFNQRFSRDTVKINEVKSNEVNTKQAKSTLAHAMDDLYSFTGLE